MRFLDVITELHAAQLVLQAVPDLGLVDRLADVERRHEAEFDQPGIHDVVHRDEIGAGFLQRRRVALERFLRGADAGIDLAGRMADHLVHVDVEQRAQCAVFLVARFFFLGVGELVRQAAGRGGKLESFHEVAERDGLRAVLLADPVRVRQVDADRR